MALGSFNPNHTAMLSMDLQSGIVSIYTRDDGLVTRTAELLQNAREAGCTIIHVKVGFRSGLPEVHRRNMLLGALKDSPAHQKLFTGDSGSIHPTVAAQEGDLVVTKSRVNAFTGTDLELLLRANEIDTLVLFGIATSGVVLATALAAADADYRLFIVKDCCADLDEAVHACLVEKVFPRCATVVTCDELRQMLVESRSQNDNAG
jgi:nicotinamidase-related amidase